MKRRREGSSSSKTFQPLPGNLSGVDVAILNWQPGDHHVGIANCLNLITIIITTMVGMIKKNLVNVKVLDDGVKEGVEVVKQVDDLHGGACRRY